MIPPGALLRTYALIFCLFILLILLVGVLFSPSLSPAFPLPPNRTPKEQKIIFIKTHKTGSSSVSTIIRRFGAVKGLKFLNPPDLRNVHTYTGLLEGQFDVICNHGRYSKSLMREAVTNGRLFTIVRDPVDRFLSVWFYFRLYRRFGELERFLANQKALEAAEAVVIGNKRFFNGMAYDLGIDRAGELNVLFSDFEKEFDLVMITERFDESLVLFKNLLGLNLSDIAHLPKKVRSLHKKISDETRRQIRELNPWDQRIYEHSLRLFDQKVAAATSAYNFEEQVDQFRTTQKQLSDFCFSSSSYWDRKCFELRKDSAELTFESRVEEMRKEYFHVVFPPYA